MIVVYASFTADHLKYTANTAANTIAIDTFCFGFMLIIISTEEVGHKHVCTKSGRVAPYVHVALYEI